MGEAQEEREKLRRYNVYCQERSRGIVHSREYSREMTEYAMTLTEERRAQRKPWVNELIEL